MHIIIQYIDTVWLPLSFFIVHRPQRWTAFWTLLGCMLMMRLQIELMENIGYGHGIIGILSSAVENRAPIVYSIFYAAFLLFAWYMKSTGSVFMVASISIFFLAFFTSTFVMVL